LSRLIVLRHGETDFNAERRYQGSMDTNLNACGRAQAAEAAVRAAGMGIDIIISSPLKRARETAEIVSAAIGVQIMIADAFSERSVGVYEGLTKDEVQARYPGLWEQNLTRRLDAAPPGGESMMEFEQRILCGLAAIVENYPNSCVLLVTHAFAAKVLHAKLMNLSREQFWDYFVDNCQMMEYKY
jgi:broad specificity phosphatase PhoE